MHKTSSARMVRRRCVALVVLPLCLGILPAMGATAPRAPPGGPTWDLRDLYPSPEAWAAALQSVRERVQTLDTLKGTLGDSAIAMRTALAAISDLRRQADRLSVYANLGADEDTRVAPAQQRRTQGQELVANIAERTAWVAPELLALGEPKVRAFLAEDEELRLRFGFSLDNTMRRAAHTLGAEAEAVLAASGLLLAQPENVFGQLSDAELPRPKVRLSSGKIVSLDLPAYEQHRGGAVRADRQRVMGGFLGALRAFRGTFGANLNARVIGDIYDARARHFGNSLEAALFDSNMPA